MQMADSAIILAGGKSMRMGFNKALLTVEGYRIVDVLSALLGEVFSQIVFVSNSTDVVPPAGVDVVADQLVDIGPLGGIHAGLGVCRSAYAFVTACDMPNLNLSYVSFMREMLLLGEIQGSVLATRFGTHIEPLSAFYHRGLRGSIEEYCRLGGRGLNGFLRGQDVALIDEAVARRFSPDWSMFANLNTEDEYRAFLLERDRLHK